MKTTIGQLVADLHDAYEERAHDPEITALATAATINDVLCGVARRSRPARARAASRTGSARAAL
jgi:hypothetical protein